MCINEYFIKHNNEKIPNSLKELGYKEMFKDILGMPCLTTTKDGFIIPSSIYNRNNAIDCDENDDMFLALAAMRDDSDKDQYFVRDEEQRWRDANGWNIIKKGSLEKCLIDDYSVILNPKDKNGKLIMVGLGPKMHKATTEEIINYFNK